MIKQTLKTLTGNLSVSIPDKLHEISLKQLMAMQAAEKLSDLDAITILSGIPLTELQQIKDYNDLHLFNEQILHLAVQIKELYKSSNIPQEVTFTINGKQTKVNVMKNLSVEPAGAFMAARDVIAEEISKHITRHGEEDWQQTFNPSLQACSQVLAYYFYSRATGQPYDEELAAAFASQVEALPVTQVLPIAKYFFFELSALIEAENRLLASPVSALEQRAGIKEFERFKYINTVNALAGGDITKWQLILNLPYNKVLTKLLLNKTEAAFQKRYAEMMSGS